MISLRWTTWAVLFATILLLLFALFVVVDGNPLQVWYYTTQVAPALHADLGFTAGRQTVEHFSEGIFVITSVVPDSAFARAGFRPGDIPTDFHHSDEVSFYRQLEEARGSVAHMSISRPGGVDGKGDMFTHMEIDVAVPPRQLK